MLFSLQTNELVYPNINVVFDESIYAVSDDTEFICNVNQRFNSNIIFPNYATSVQIGGNPSDFNYPIEVPNTVTNLHNMFSGCSNYNQAFNIPSNVTNCKNMFYSCYKYNRPTTIPNPVNDLSQMFYGCYNFNQPIIIPNEAVYCASMFRDCYNFNQPINITDRVLDCSSMFYGCRNFNQPVSIGRMVTNYSSMFFGCQNFNQSIIIHNIAANASYMFNGANNLNSPIYLYMQSMVNARYMFNGCNLLSHFFINGLINNYQPQYMLRNNGNYMLNIYTDDVGQDILSTTRYLMTNGATPTWTTDSDNGCIYNTVMNVYIYNNWDGVIS